jgi:hypothetical protein
MQNKKLPIRKIVAYLNDEESEGGGFWLPNIQRPFVWTEEQIGRLFDSIMREYPISTLLAWKTKETVKHRKFIDNYHADIRLTDFFVPDNRHAKLLVLDGQQRLQSLFIGLRGSYEGRELYFDLLSGSPTAPEDIRYRFAFKEKSQVAWPWVRFKDLVSTNKLPGQYADALIRECGAELSSKQNETVHLNVERARQEFVNDDNITYQELDGIDNPEAYRVDDIVEIFIRANSGGTKLGKSDLLFSLLTSSWEDADGEMEALLEDLNQGRFAFDRDFVLKTCLTLLGKGARYDVNKFRDGNTKEQIVAKWADISAAIRFVRDWVTNNTFIRSDKAIPSYLALIPLVYFRYHYPSKWNTSDRLRDYLLRSLITGVFSGNPDNMIDKIVRSIDEHQGLSVDETFAVMRAEGRSLEITPDVIFSQGYGSRAIHLFFNLWYSDFDYNPALGENGPQIDHIFPQSLLRSVKDINPDSGKRNILHYRSEQRDQIANCMLLTAEENGFGDKNDSPPKEWFALERFSSTEARDNYFKLHLIPSDPALWELENFEAFVEARKRLIEKKFDYLIQSDAKRSPVGSTSGLSGGVV